MEREEVLYDWHQRSPYNMGLGYSLLEMEFTPRLKRWQSSLMYAGLRLSFIWRCDFCLLTHYAAYFIFKFVHGNYGFENQEVEVSISSGDAVERCIIFLDPDGRLRHQYQTTQERPAATEVLAREKQIPRGRGDGWKEVDLGEFFVSDPPAWDVRISLMEVKTNKWKSGLVIEGIELHPLHR